MTTNRRSALADRLIAGVNSDPDQRAAIQLLCTAAGGICLSKLDGWPEYLRARDVTPALLPGLLLSDRPGP